MLGVEELRQIVDQYGHDRSCRLKLCVDVLLYYDGGFKANADGVVHFYREALGLIGSAVTYYNTDGRELMRKRKRDTLEMLPFWAEPTTEARGIYGLRLESGPTARDVSDQAFDSYDDRNGLGYVRLLLPLEFVADRGDALVALALRAADRLRFASGSGGYAVNMDSDYQSQHPTGPVYAVSRRFRGIDFGTPNLLARFHAHGIKSVNWLTFLGEPYVTRLGGLATLKAALGAEITVHELRHGVMIQAGPAPGLGDVNRQERLPLYHRVGRVLAPVRFTQEVFKRYNEVGGGDNTAEWLARFDQ